MSKPNIIVADTTGHEVSLAGASLDNFQAFRQAFQNETRESNIDEVEQTQSETAKGGDKGLEMHKDGILSSSSSGCKGKNMSYVPWARIDGIELQLGCLGIGGSAYLVTEGGDKYRVASQLCSSAPLWQVFDRVNGLKFGVGKSQGGKALATFNINSAARYTSQVDTQKITIVQNRRIREWDLERVVSCQVVKQSWGKEVLILCLLAGPGQKEVVEVPVKSVVDEREEKQSAVWLAKLICNQAKARKSEDHSAQRQRKPESPAAATVAEPVANGSGGETAAPSAVEPKAQAVQESARSWAIETEAPPERQLEEGAFLVSLRPRHYVSDSKNSGLVIHVRTAEQQSALYVQELMHGPVEKWNEENPNQQVQSGDFIVEVDGVRNDLITMIARLNRQLPFEFVVKRTWP